MSQAGGLRKTLIVGATSAIAQATARRLAGDGDAFFLVARDASKLGAVAEDLRVRGTGHVETAVMDVLDYDRHAAVIAHAIEALEGLDVALIAHGTLPDQKACEESFESTRQALEINALSVMSLVTHLANHFERQKRGTIAVISSVAGERGRRSNYVYGTAKGAVDVFMQDLRNRLARSGVHVLTIKPGFVDTPMTAGFRKGLLWARPERIATDIRRAIEKRSEVVYTPWYWRYVMQLIRAVPESIFKRLKL